MSKYVRVMDGLKSNAGGFEYKLDEVNIADKWNPNSLKAEETGGFNFGTEDKILRWLHRGDTIYDVIIPDDAKVIKVNDEKGIYRSNKIIVTNPRKITDEMVVELYKKSNLSNKIIAQCLLTLIWKNRLEISKYIIKDRVDIDNVNEILESFSLKRLIYFTRDKIFALIKLIMLEKKILIFQQFKKYFEESGLSKKDKQEKFNEINISIYYFPII